MAGGLWKTDFIDSFLVENLSFTTPLSASSKKLFEAFEVKKKLTNNSQNLISQMGAERNTFSQHDLLSVGHNVDLELTLPFFLDL